MHLIRHLQPVARQELINLTGKSQPTITRATAALLKANLIRPRPDLATSPGPGRPKMPLELVAKPFVHVGIALGTHTTYVGAYNNRGVAIREQRVRLSAAQVPPGEFLASVLKTAAQLTEDQVVASLGVTTSGLIDQEGRVTAPNLGWKGVNLAALLSASVKLPVTVAGVVEAIAAAELQALAPDDTNTTMVFYADDSVGAAMHDSQTVRALSGGGLLQDTSTRSLTDAVIHLVSEVQPDVLLLAGQAFEQPTEARSVASALKQVDLEPSIRVFPRHLDNARAAARAIALDRLIADPLWVVDEVAVRDWQRGLPLL